MIRKSTDKEAERPLKIAIIHTADHGGGAERSVLTLHHSMLQLGHESRLYVGNKLSNSPNVTKIERVRTIPGLLLITHWLEQTLGWQYLYSPGFRRLGHIIDQDTDVLHIQSLWGASGYADIGALPRLTRRFPTIITFREQWLLTGHCACPFDCSRWQTGCGHCPDLTLAPSIPRDGTRFNWYRKRIALRRSDARITTVSGWLRGVVIRSPMMTGKLVSVVYNGIDGTIFTPDSRGAARAELQLPQDRFIVLLAGQSIEGINQGIAQHAVPAMNHCKNNSLMAILVGKSAQLVAKSLSLPKKILPFQELPEDMVRCFRAADVTLVTSEYESFGRIAAESQACGTPVISFATGGLPEVVKHGVGGLLVPIGDIQALSSAIQRLLANPAEIEHMGRNGAKWARQQFSSLKIAREYVDLYREVISERWAR